MLLSLPKVCYKLFKCLSLVSWKNIFCWVEFHRSLSMWMWISSSPVRRRKTNDGLREIVQRWQNIRVSIENEQRDLVRTEVATFLQGTLEIHLSTRNRCDRESATDVDEGFEHLVYIGLGAGCSALIHCKHRISAASLSYEGFCSVGWEIGRVPCDFLLMWRPRRPIYMAVLQFQYT